mgnify:CR=1 FL=1
MRCGTDIAQRTHVLCCAIMVGARCSIRIFTRRFRHLIQWTYILRLDTRLRRRAGPKQEDLHIYLHKAEYDRALLAFIGKAEKPILLEVFTDKDVDIRQMGIATNSVKSESAAQMYKMAAALPDPLKRTIKSIIRKK